MADAVQLLIDALTIFGPLGLMSLAFASVLRTAHHLHFALPGIWIVDAYIFGALLEQRVHYLAAAVITFVVSVLASLLCYSLYRRLRSKFAVALAGFGLFLSIAAIPHLIWGASPVGVDPSRWLAGGWLVSVAGGRVFVNAVAVVSSGLLLGVLVALASTYARTKTGLFTLAVAQDRELSVATGIRVGRVELQAYTFSGLLVALAAVLHVGAFGASAEPGLSLFVQALLVALLSGAVIVATGWVALAFGVVWALLQALAGTTWVILLSYTIFISAVAIWPGGVIRREFLIGRRG